MISTQAVQVIERVRGFWPSPAMTDQECAAWMSELTDPAKNIEFDRALSAVSRLSSTDRFRPPVGQFVQKVRGLTPAAAPLPQPAIEGDCAERATRWMQKIRAENPSIFKTNRTVGS